MSVNKSGIKPCEFKVLIKQDSIEDTDPDLARAKAAGLLLAKETKDREQMAQVAATLIAIGGNAFEDWKGEIPVPGQRVLTAKYAGYETTGKDKEKYRICNDKDIAAVLT